MDEHKWIAKRLSSLCPGISHSYYTKIKILTDPLYQGVFDALKGSSMSLLDIGCGMGVLAFYLRERGIENPILGVDFDARKISDANTIAMKGGYEEISFETSDARQGLPEHQGDVTVLDILQYMNEGQQENLLRELCQRVPATGRLVIRSGVREESWRFRFTWMGDMVAKLCFWMKAAPVNYPTKCFLKTILEAEGLQVEMEPFWGKTPFNNYLVVATRL